MLSSQLLHTPPERPGDPLGVGGPVFLDACAATTPLLWKIKCEPIFPNITESNYLKNTKTYGFSSVGAFHIACPS